MIEIEKPNLESVILEPTYGKFVVEPLERGFGTTLGNSLRFRAWRLPMCVLTVCCTNSARFRALKKM